MKKVFLTLIFVLFSISLSYASIPVPTATFNLNPFSGDFYSEVNVDSGLFTHEYVFSIGDGTVDAFAAYWNVTNKRTGEVFRDIDDFSFSLFSGTTELENELGEDYIEFYRYLSAGTYSLFVSGDAIGTKGGVYALGVTAVPVPGAAILLGSALLGLVGVRKRKTV